MPAPVADFSCNLLNLVNASFTDLSTNIPTSWVWEYSLNAGVNWIQFSILKNPILVLAIGIYCIRLTATNINGSNTKVKLSFLSRTNPTSNIPPEMMRRRRRYM